MGLAVDERSAADEPWFRNVRRTPTGQARELVRESWVVQAARCRTAVERALPDAAVEIYFNLDRAGRHLYTGGAHRELAPRQAWVVGPHAKPLLVEKEIADCDVAGVRLELGVASRVLGVPARELCDSLIDLDVFWGCAVETLRDQLHGMNEPHARMSFLESVIVGRVSSPVKSRTHDDALVHSMHMTASRVARITIGELAAMHGLTHRRAIALLEESVGLKPKLLHRVQRVRSVIRAVHAPRRAPWTDIAHRCGYFDQAHLINDFRALAGITPTEYDAKRSSVGRGFAQHIAASSLQR